ncbi:MAG: mitochondrial fusion and transport protein ugo1 [Claussenomyces sp. TS43310]|nr:MAG: mitochondrial fusion and transport protein ugo1 [Claussenomyces sp. TS43310]
MSTPREGPNPLRPYYIPPSIGLSPEISTSTSSHAHASGNRSGATTSNYKSSARDIFSDIDYSDYVSDGSQSTLDLIRELLDQALYKYLSVLLAQPFDVAKTILQVRTQAIGDGSIQLVDGEETRGHSASYKESVYPEYPSDESDPDEPAYFTSSAPSSTSYSPSRSRRRHVTDRAGYVLPSPSSSSPAPHQLVLKRSDSIFEVISQLWTKEGAWGVWKASNSTFIYSVLFKTTESWSRSLLAALANVPDPGVIAGLGVPIDIVDSTHPWASLAVAVAAAAMAGVILAPLDIIRTKLVLTSTSTSKKRGLRHDLRRLPSYLCPPGLYIPTILHSIISPLLTHGAPLILRTRFAIDQVLTPTTFSIATFLTSTLELFVKLPLETVLRRGQVSVLASPRYMQGGKRLDTIVDVGPYRGVAGTMWSIVREEGKSHEGKAESSSGQGGRRARKLGERKGQGVEGLWRGWRVGFWGLVGMWTVAAMSGNSGSGEF